MLTTLLARLRARRDRGESPPAGAARGARADLPDLSWIDEWAANVRDYVFVRRADRLFIQRPQRAFHVNAAAVDLLEGLFRGRPIAELLAPHGGDPRVWRDTEAFFLELRRILKEGADDTTRSPAVEKTPFALGFSKLPVLSEVAVTYRCNARCRFCYAGCNCTTNPVGCDREMTLDEVKRVLDTIRTQAQVPSVSFTGGEATLRPDLPDMVRHARSLGLRVNLITNGILATEARVDALAEAGLHSAQVSIEGTRAEIHEEITRIPGSFARAVSAVERFRERGLTVHTNTTITRCNAEDVVELPRFVRERLALGTFSMNLMIPTGSGALDRQLVVRYTEVGAILERVLDECTRHGVKLEWYSPTPLCIFNPIAHGMGNKGCSACDGLISVAADGQVLPCASYDEPVGNLLEQPFEAIWEAPEARDFRAKGRAHPSCRSCEHFALCNGACPLYWRHQGFGELPHVAAETGTSRPAASDRRPKGGGA